MCGAPLQPSVSLLNLSLQTTQGQLSCWGQHDGVCCAGGIHPNWQVPGDAPSSSILILTIRFPGLSWGVSERAKHMKQCQGNTCKCSFCVFSRSPWLKVREIWHHFLKNAKETLSMWHTHSLSDRKITLSSVPVYKASLRTASATQWNPVSKKGKKNQWMIFTQTSLGEIICHVVYSFWSRTTL